jgi:hypothetical protein
MKEIIFKTFKIKTPPHPISTNDHRPKSARSPSELARLNPIWPWEGLKSSNAAPTREQEFPEPTLLSRVGRSDSPFIDRDSYTVICAGGGNPRATPSCMGSIYHTNIPHHTLPPLAVVVIHYGYLFVALVRRSWERRREEEGFRERAHRATRSVGRDKANETGAGGTGGCV